MPFFYFVTYADYGHQYRELDRGDLVMLVCSDSRFVLLYYLRRKPEGWVVDIAGSIRNSQELICDEHTWTWRNGNDDYSTAFFDQVVLVDNVWRMRGGDYRPIPVNSISLLAV